MVRARDQLRHSSEPSLLVLGFGSGNGAEQIKHASQRYPGYPRFPLN